MKLEFTYLRSRLARRIFWLFVVCALLPISVLSLVSLFSVSSELKDQSRRRLSQVTRDEGMIVFERLNLLEANLRTFGSDPSLVKGSARIPAYVEAHFTSLAELSPGGNVQALAGQPIEPFLLSDQEETFVNWGRALLKVRLCGKSDPCVYLVVKPQPSAEGSGLLVGEVRREFLWGSDELPESMNLCIRDQQERTLFCSASDQQSPANPAFNGVEWKESGRTYVAQAWKLPMKARFLEDHWTFLVTESTTAALSSLGSFRRNFPLVILLAFWVVLLLSIIEIRRTLVPLEKLREGTKRIAGGEFRTHVDVRSEDEFQELASSFNYMAGRIDTQIHSLKTLNEIDRAILSAWKLSDIVEALISRLPELLQYDMVGVTVVNSAPVGQATTHVARVRGELRALDTEISVDELQFLKDQEEVFAATDKASTLRFLQPLVAEGMGHFLVLPIVVENKLSAALTFGRSRNGEWTRDDRQQARQVADQVAVAITNARLVSQLKELHWGTLVALARAIDAKSSWTAGHSEGVTAMALKIGREIGLSGDEIDVLHAGGLLHDVGKIGTPVHLLDKPGPLTPEERVQVQEHVMTGVRILGPLPGFEKYIPIVREHHEWFNGNGYPQGIAGENISFLARVLAVADVYDALISDRPYRMGMPLHKVETVIRDSSGTQFDPRVVDAFLRVLARESKPRVVEAEPLVAVESK
jgi:putative nucleotidyltransferase with HDIG domain